MILFYFSRCAWRFANCCFFENFPKSSRIKECLISGQWQQHRPGMLHRWRWHWQGTPHQWQRRIAGVIDTDETARYLRLLVSHRCRWGTPLSLFIAVTTGEALVASVIVTCVTYLTALVVVDIGKAQISRQMVWTAFIKDSCLSD